MLYCQFKADPEKTAENVINDFLENNSFDPFACLTGQESKKQVLYGLCVNYLEALKRSKEEITNNFLNDLKTLYGYNNPAPVYNCSYEDLDALEGRCLHDSID